MRPKITMHLVLVGALVLGLLPACAAPTLPLPPPVALITGPPDAMGNVTVQVTSAGAANYVFVYNHRTEAGVIGLSSPTGTFTAVIPAAIGDSLEVWYMEGTRVSPPAQGSLTVPAM